jgi:hypothetical protein
MHGVVTLDAHGIRARLPRGFEGRIFRRRTIADEVPRPVAHFATVPLPPDTSDFGGGLVTTLQSTDVFVVLFEYGPESVGKALFATEGMPRRLGTGHFRPCTLRRGLGGQSGSQWFFTENGRPFTLYAVLGSHARRHSLIAPVNSLLHHLEVAPAEPGRSAVHR